MQLKLWMVPVAVVLVALVLLAFAVAEYRQREPVQAGLYSAVSQVNSSSSGPSYFVHMELGNQKEQAGEFWEAIPEYRLALADLSGVAESRRNQAKIDAHNRIASCSLKEGGLASAWNEYHRSLALGDDKIAPEAITKMKPPTDLETKDQFDFLLRFHPRVSAEVTETHPYVELIRQHSFVFSPDQRAKVLRALDRELSKKRGWERYEVRNGGIFVDYKRRGTVLVYMTYGDYKSRVVGNGADNLSVQKGGCVVQSYRISRW